MYHQGDRLLDVVVVVVGGGQAGLAVAWHLARRGLGFVSWRPARRSATSGGRAGTH